MASSIEFTEGAREHPVNTNLELTNGMNHQPNPADVQARQLRGNLWKRARVEMKSIQGETASTKFYCDGITS